MFSFDARTVQPWVGFELVPPGWAKVAIRKSNFKPNQAATGTFLELQYEILEGPAKGKSVLDRLNIQNPSTEAVEIAFRKLSAICYCTGVISITGQQQQDFAVGPMHGIPFWVEVGVQKSQRGNDMNVVNAYKDINGREPGQQGQPQGGVMPSAPPAPPAPPAPSAPTMAPPAPTVAAQPQFQPAQQQPQQAPQYAPHPGPQQPGQFPQAAVPAAPGGWQPGPAPAPAPAFPGGQPAQQWQQPQGQPPQPAPQPGAAPAWVNQPR